jgi:hypothetical protein
MARKVRSFFKNLFNLQNRQLKRIVAIDKDFLPYINTLANFVPILPFDGSDDDTELLNLLEYLDEVLKNFKVAQNIPAINDQLLCFQVFLEAQNVKRSQFKLLN